VAIGGVAGADLGEQAQGLGQALGQRRAAVAARASSRQLDTIERTFYPEV